MVKETRGEDLLSFLSQLCFQASFSCSGCKLKRNWDRGWVTPPRRFNLRPGSQ